MINSIGNLGGFLGPCAVGYVTGATGSFAGVVVLLSILTLMAGVIILMLLHSEQRLAAVREVGVRG
jgi:ACS family tartrate transporter-like MFS transporter